MVGARDGVSVLFDNDVMPASAVVSQRYDVVHRKHTVSLCQSGTTVSTDMVGGCMCLPVLCFVIMCCAVGMLQDSHQLEQSALQWLVRPRRGL